jgi:hypothetical protein
VDASLEVVDAPVFARFCHVVRHSFLGGNLFPDRPRAGRPVLDAHFGAFLIRERQKGGFHAGAFVVSDMDLGNPPNPLQDLSPGAVEVFPVLNGTLEADVPREPGNRAANVVQQGV